MHTHTCALIEAQLRNVQWHYTCIHSICTINVVECLAFLKRNLFKSTFLGQMGNCFVSPRYQEPDLKEIKIGVLHNNIQQNE